MATSKKIIHQKFKKQRVVSEYLRQWWSNKWTVDIAYFILRVLYRYFWIFDASFFVLSLPSRHLSLLPFPRPRTRRRYQIHTKIYNKASIKGHIATANSILSTNLYYLIPRKLNREHFQIRVYILHSPICCKLRTAIVYESELRKQGRSKDTKTTKLFTVMFFSRENNKSISTKTLLSFRWTMSRWPIRQWRRIENWESNRTRLHHIRLIFSAVIRSRSSGRCATEW